jgi:hypothetical protein
MNREPKTFKHFDKEKQVNNRAEPIGNLDNEKNEYL